jgi:SAM-dependent methyltransferase
MNSDATIVEREREYHNLRFTEETRDAQDKYYFALRDCDAKYERLILERARDAVVLDYGCAKGEWALKIAPVAKQVHGIDISDVAIDAARAEAARLGLGHAHFDAMDAHKMTFPDNTFDLVFGLGIIHHLDTRLSLQEVARVLKPGGVAIFREPLGYNMLINLYRNATPEARTVDEHPLVHADEKIAGELFKRNGWEFYGLATLGVVPLRNTRLGEPLFRFAAAIDRTLFKIPLIRWQAWAVLMTLEK